MEKYGTYRKVIFSIERTHGYGRYLIRSFYRGTNIKVETTDSESWDWLDDTSNKQKHNAARLHCYYKIVSQFENDMNNK
jgi:hypothetical protein